MEDVCSICLENLSENIQLNCGHFLHPQCLKILSRRNTDCRCPLCRVPVNQEIINKVDNRNVCSLCDEEITREEANMDYVNISKCGCNLHYSCWRKYLQSNFPFEVNNDQLMPFNCNIKCPSCQEETLYYKVEGRDYGYLKSCHETYVGEIHNCLRFGCCYYANPQRYGYCSVHARKKASNRAIKRTLEFMCKFGGIMSTEKCNRIFYDFLRKVDKKLNAEYDVDIDSYGLEYCQT